MLAVTITITIYEHKWHIYWGADNKQTDSKQKVDVKVFCCWKIDLKYSHMKSDSYINMKIIKYF